jgi:hypothetical protein
MLVNSSNAQDETQQKIERKNSLETFKIFRPVIDPNDIDPYFVENQDLVSNHGPEVITRNIIQDKNGYFWFATWNGIVG